MKCSLLLRELCTSFDVEQPVLPCRFVEDCIRQPVGGVFCALDGNRIPRGILVHVCGAMADPLAPAIHRDPHVQLQFAHLKRGRVVMPHEVSDQTTVLVHPPGPSP